jgi:hypothetical protein
MPVMIQSNAARPGVGRWSRASSSTSRNRLLGSHSVCGYPHSDVINFDQRRRAPGTEASSRNGNVFVGNGALQAFFEGSVSEGVW